MDPKQADIRYMERALELAAGRRGFTRPNPTVGCVLVKGGEVIAEGAHQRAGEPHAEALVLREAGERAKGATMYVTLEPCPHHGRTPPCADATIAAGVLRVVAATLDPNPIADGAGIAKLRTAGIEVEHGLLGARSRALNEPFEVSMRLARPLIALKFAASLDGKTATAGGQSKWITGDLARARGRQLRGLHDAILVGIETVLADDPQLTCRSSQGYPDPLRVVLDSNARLPLDSRLVQSAAEVPVVVAVTEAADAAACSRLTDAGVRVQVLPSDSQGRADITALPAVLHGMEIRALLVEGGATVHGSFLSAGLVDRVYAFLAPRLLGGASAPGAIAGGGIESLADAGRLVKTELELLEGDVLISGVMPGSVLAGI